MIKNMEWGALIYLSHSKYGRNATQMQEFDHNYAGGTQGATPFTNQLQSTTANNYGVFDMLSLVASYSSSANTELAEYMIAGAEKYKECYSSYPTTTYGDAIYEIAKTYRPGTGTANSNAAWYSGGTVWLENNNGNTNSHNFLARLNFGFEHVRDTNSTGTSGITDNTYHIILWP